MDLWLKEIGPSNELRRWFGHDPDKWNEFRKKYFQELERKRDLVGQILEMSQDSDIVLLFGAKDNKYNNAFALKEYIDKIEKTRNKQIFLYII